VFSGCLDPTLSRQSVGMDGWLESAANLTLETDFWHRHRDLPSLRTGGANHCLNRESGRDSELFDHLKTIDETCGPFSYPKAALLLDRMRLTASSSFNLGCCYLEAHGRVPAGRPPGMLRTWRWRGRPFRCLPIPCGRWWSLGCLDLPNSA